MPVRFRRLAPALLATAVAVSSVAGVARAAAGTARVPGRFALAGARPEATAELTATPAGALTERLEIVERARGTTVDRYAVDMTKTMHLIVVGDRWRTFMHLHPALDRAGRFTIAVTFPHPGGYEIYADAQPSGLAHQVFRFPLVVGTAAAARVAPPPPATGRSADAGPYVVTLGSDRLRAGGETRLAVTITRDGEPATGLRPYLGGAAHAVFIDTRTLDYLHVHPLPAGTPGSPVADEMATMGDMSAMPELPPGASVPPRMTLHVTAPTAGTYLLWLQFRSPSGLEVAPFVLTAA